MPETEPTKKYVLADVAAKQRKELAELLAERAKWQRIKTEAEDNAANCSILLVPLLQKLGIKNILAPDDTGTDKVFILTHGVNTSIKRELLLVRGVDPDIIEDCTVRTQYDSVQVRKVAK